MYCLSSVIFCVKILYPFVRITRILYALRVRHKYTVPQTGTYTTFFLCRWRLKFRPQYPIFDTSQVIFSDFAKQHNDKQSLPAVYTREIDTVPSCWVRWQRLSIGRMWAPLWWRATRISDRLWSKERDTSMDLLCCPVAATGPDVRRWCLPRIRRNLAEIVSR